MTDPTAQPDSTAAERRQRAWARYAWLLVNGRADAVMMGEMRSVMGVLGKTDNDLAAHRDLLQRAAEAVRQLRQAKAMLQHGSREQGLALAANAQDRLLFLTAQNPELLAHVQDLAAEPAAAGGAS